MTSFQKVIKYLAIAFAVFLIVNIVSGIYYGVSTLVTAFTEDDSDYISDVLKTIEVSNDEILSLEIDIDSTSLTIKNGNEFMVETNNEYISSSERNGKLILKEKNRNWFRRSSKSELVITLPLDIKFDNVDIDTGSGKIRIEQLITEKLDFDFGAGSTEIESLEVFDNAKIDGGAGKIKILSGDINDLDLDLGVGEFTMSSSLTGNNKIDAGIGEVNIDLIGNLEQYKIKASKGIGNIRLDGEKIKNDTLYGTGDNYLEIDGGIGDIEIELG